MVFILNASKQFAHRRSEKQDVPESTLTFIPSLFYRHSNVVKLCFMQLKF